MKRIFLISLSFLLVSNASNNASIDFEAYIAQLVKIKIITEAELNFFAEQLEKNELVNPIDCEKVHCDSERTLHFDTLEEHLKADLDLETLKTWLHEFIKKRKHDQQTREDTKKLTKPFKGNIPKRIAFNNGQTCAINKERKVICWGPKRREPESKDNIHIPNNMGPLKEISAGNNHVCALEDSGKVQCWGHLERGVPSDLAKVVQISTVLTVSYVLEEGGTMKAWSENLNVNTLKIPPDLGPVSQFSLGWYHVCVLDENLKLKCWGTGSANAQSSVPPNLGPVLQSSGSRFHNCAILEDESVRCWGSNLYGQSTVPSDLGPVFQISITSEFSCALKINGIAKCWGDSARVLNPKLSALGPLVQISTFEQQICVVKQNAKVQCFGNDLWGRDIRLLDNYGAPPEDLEVYIDDLLPRFDFERKL